MPHMTQAYPFEWKVLGFAASLASKLAGRGHHSFLMMVDGDGSVQSLQFECPEDGWHKLTAKLDEAGASYIFYDPFDTPDYTWMSWRNIDRSTMERFIGNRFGDADFVKAEHSASQAPELNPLNTYPASWGVMC